MSYRGTFGTESSTTGGDLPSNPNDGDLYDCAAAEDYASAVAGITFSPAQQAIFVSDTGWTARPMAGSDPAKADLTGGNLLPPDVASWQNILAINGKAALDASNLSSSDVSAWQAKLGTGPGPTPGGGTYESIYWNTVYAPIAYDRFVSAAK
ncbi:MAG: hypothetical protein LBI34_03230 [Puniceicoccales bacterium]|nr:hypothetical protein [Puniceicoccales bacterium]